MRNLSLKDASTYEKIWFIITWHRRPINCLWLSPSFASLTPYVFKKELKIIDLNFYNESRFLQELNKIKPEYIAFSCYIDNVSEINDLINKCKKIYPHVKIIVGGTHVTLLQNKIYKIFPKDVNIIFGDGEKQLFNLLNASLNSSYKNKSKDNDLKNNKLNFFQGNYIKNFNALKFPDYKSLIQYPHFPVINIETSRGCIFGCPYCAYAKLSGKKLRMKSIENVNKEINGIINNYNIRQFRFVDSNLTNPPLRFNELMLSFIKRNKKIKWCCFSRLDQLSKFKIELAKKAGCISMFVGIESGCYKTLKMIGKPYNEKEIINFSKIAKSLGIHIHANFIIGFPNENEDSIEDTIRTIRNSEFPSITVNPLYLIPYSDFHLNKNKWNIKIFDKDWELNLHKYFRDSSKVFFNHSSLSQDKLLNFIKDIKMQIYKSKNKYWDLKDYSVVAWYSIGGSLDFLKKIWKNPEDTLIKDEIKYFNAFRDRQLTTLSQNDRLLLLSKLKTIINNYDKNT